MTERRHSWGANNPHPDQERLGSFHPEVLAHHIAEFKRRSKESPGHEAEFRYRIKRFREYARWRRVGWIDDFGRNTRR